MKRKKYCLREEKGFGKQKGDNQVIDNDVEGREEKLFKAIGDLSEDMIAEAANYQCPKKGTDRFGKWYRAGKGLAFAACLFFVILAAPRLYNAYISGNEQTRIAGELIAEQRSGTTSGEVSLIEKQEAGEKNGEAEAGDTEIEGDSTENMVEDKIETEAGGIKKEIQLWADTKEREGSKAKKEGKKEAGKKYGKTKMEAGKTLHLQVKEAKGIGGEAISVVSLTIGETGDDIKYTLDSELSNCRIMSVANIASTKRMDAKTADCTGGDEIELNTSQKAMASWETHPVPEWSGTDINVLDIVTITGEIGDEEYEFGRIVFGKKGEEYYGVYQKEYD